MYVQSDYVEIRVVDQVGTILLNRPDHGNALTRRMVLQIGEALEDLYYDGRVRAIVLTGAGQSFSIGADLAESHAAAEQEDPQQQWGEEAADLRDLLVQLLEITKPVIAAVNGPALSTGASLVAAADIVIAAQTAQFGLPDARYGLVAGLEAPLLCHRIGTSQAARLLLTGTPIDAEEAVRLGLFHELVDFDQVWARATEVAEQCARCAPEAIQLTKRLLLETAGEQLSTQLAAGAVMRATARTTDAAAKGIAANLEGREPDWG